MVPGQGFLAARRGSRAVQLGPCLAAAEAGPRLLADAWHRWAGQRVLLDIPMEHTAARALPEKLGWTVRRQFLRMVRGPGVVERVDQIWATSGPEKG